MLFSELMRVSQLLVLVSDLLIMITLVCWSSCWLK